MIGFVTSLLRRKVSDPLLEALDKDEFYKWLKTKPSSQLVGFTHLVSACPIAFYLRSKGFQYVSVSQHEVMVETRTKTYCLIKDDKLPAWIVEFVVKVDSAAFSDFPDDINIDSFHREVTASQALEVLQKL